MNRHLETALHQAAMKGAVVALEFLVTNKAEPNMQNEFGETALHYAVRLGAIKCIELLLAANADVFLEGDREEGSALTLAEVTGQTEILVMMKRSSSYTEHVKKYGVKSTLRGGTAKTADSKNDQTATTAPAAAAAASAVAAAVVPAAAGAPNVAKANAVSAVSSASRATKATNLAFGVARGACGSGGCDCGMYRCDGGGDSGGGPCQNCGHFPAAHARLGSGTSGAEEPAAAAERALQTCRILGRLKQTN